MIDDISIYKFNVVKLMIHIALLLQQLIRLNIQILGNIHDGKFMRSIGNPHHI